MKRESNGRFMKCLFLGAGAIGGYFGGKLAAAGADVTFLVRPQRAEQLARDGLTLRGPSEAVATRVKTIAASDVKEMYDCVLLTAKAYDLDSAISAIAPAVGETTRVLPLLNGMRHLDVLDAAFGAERVLGGTCHISTTLNPDGSITRFNEFAALTQGPRSPSQAEFCRRLHDAMRVGGFDARLSETIIGAMWDKWVLLATLAGSTCLMRANIGEIVATDAGAGLISSMLDESAAIAAAAGYAPNPQSLAATRTVLTDSESTMSASMRRDIERGARTEASHIIGDLIARGAALGVDAPLLGVAFTHLQAHDARLDARL